MVNGRCTTPSNQSFHESLLSQDPRWGYRDIAQLRGLGEESGLLLDEVRDMPANNFALIFSKPSRAS